MTVMRGSRHVGRTLITRSAILQTHGEVASLEASGYPSMLIALGGFAEVLITLYPSSSLIVAWAPSLRPSRLCPSSSRARRALPNL